MEVKKDWQTWELLKLSSECMGVHYTNCSTFVFVQNLHIKSKKQTRRRGIVRQVFPSSLSDEI